MHKVKISEFDMMVVITGLNVMKDRYNTEKRTETVSVLSTALLYHKKMKPNKSKKIPFVPAEKRVIVHCLNDWRNAFLSEGKYPEAEQVGDTMTLFLK